MFFFLLLLFPLKKCRLSFVCILFVPTFFLGVNWSRWIKHENNKNKSIICYDRHLENKKKRRWRPNDVESESNWSLWYNYRLCHTLDVMEIFLKWLNLANTKNKNYTWFSLLLHFAWTCVTIWIAVYAIDIRAAWNDFASSTTMTTDGDSLNCSSARKIKV